MSGRDGGLETLGGTRSGDQLGGIAAPSTAWLVMVHGAGAPAVHRLAPGGTTVGREGADVLAGDPRVSRKHLAFTRAGARWELADLGSRNGATVGGVPLAPGATRALHDGSVVRAGDTLLVFRLGAEPDPRRAGHAWVPGWAPAVSAARDELARLAIDPVPVLVLGETGTGKEFAARFVHALLPRKGAPFVPVNCGELKGGLARAELFGTERGIYTDAAERPGLIAAADGGVLFLDEIGDLDAGVQVELLRFLEDGKYRAVGGSKLHESTARVVAATHVDLDAAAADGRFRRDLLGRLRRAALPVVLPPLRERPEDVPMWIARFLERQSQEARYSAGFLERLLVHDWPENLRELEGVVRTAARKAAGGELKSEHLPDALRRSGEKAPIVARKQGDSSKKIRAAVVRAPEPNQEEIQRALTETDGNVREAAKRLGVERTRLYRWCRDLGIEIEKFRRGGGEEEAR